MISSKAEIDRLGNKIRTNISNIPFEDILELQDYRTSHQLPLSNVFNVICEYSDNKRGNAIATYRLKRFESLINKLERFPKMRFSRMWDIGGCRIIVESEKEVYEILTKVDEDARLNIRKVTDYNKEISNDGYRAIHIYAEYKSNGYPIEIQIRTTDQHNWATLVEITDLIYDTRLKEIGVNGNKELYKFHQYLSNLNSLTNENCTFIYKTMRKYNFLEKLNEIFSNNYINVRKQWYELEQNNSQKYYLIEVDKNNTTKLKSFSKFYDAEKAYFDLYKSHKDSNAVVTYQRKYDFKLLTTAYANYILTYHSFLKESLEILETLIYESILLKKYYFAYTVYDYYNNLVHKFMEVSINEIEESIKIHLPNINNKFLRKKQQEWTKDISKQLRVINESVEKLNENMTKITISNSFYNYIYVQAIKITKGKYTKRLRRTLRKSQIFKETLK